MYIAMNRFKIRPGQETRFEEIWRNRDSHLQDMDGFRNFHLLKGPVHDDYALYSSHTVWESKQHFDAWTHSESFRQSHRGAGAHSDLYLGHPEFEGFEAVLELTSQDA